MKKIILAAVLLFAGITLAHADNERPIKMDRLPKAAQEFLTAHFGELTLAYAVEETNFYGSEYEVTYTDRTEVEFRTDGQWHSVKRKYAPIPEAVVPEKIREFVVKQAAPYPGQFIREIERDLYTWEVTLSNGIEIKFDLKFNVIGYDD